MTLEVMTRSERSVAHVARKGRLVNVLVLGERCLSCEDLSTGFMKLFVFYELCSIAENLAAQLAPIPLSW